MKGISTGILFLVFWVMAYPVAGLAQKIITGGYATVLVTNVDVMRAASFAIKAQKQVGEQTGQFELIEILRAESQVVAGMNYRLMLKVRVDGKERTAEAVVWWQAWRKPEPYQLTSWSWH
ncbi:MAG: cystatin domain-containing protein [Desulfobulbus sp.]|nr:cystatin domain-containing protein [Desulfobulbus sp.]